MSEPITLSHLQEQIRSAIAAGVAVEQWVAAEISELKVNYAGHCYLELVERQQPQEAEDSAAPQRPKKSSRTATGPVAQARATIWAHAFKLISGYFRFETGSDLEAGMRILFKCAVTYHPVYGLSLNISDIDPAYTLGETERLRRQTIARLQQEGVFGMNRELELPQVVQRLAVISSASAAGYQDFVQQLQASGYGFSVQLFGAVMQGQAAETSIVEALDAIASDASAYDAVAIIRGGGSTSDLGTFDSYRLGAYIAQFPLPIITGIGHDKDVSVADMVAHTALKTPTAVAAFLIDGARELDGLLESLGQRLRQQAIAALDRQAARLEWLSVSVEGASPARILARGYAIVRGADGRAVQSARGVRSGDRVQITLHDGAFGAQVEAQADQT